MYNNLQNSQTEGQSEGQNKPPKKTFIKKVREFLDIDAITILSVAAATAIAFSFKDLVFSISTNIVHPLSIKLISLIGLSKYINFGDSNSYNFVKNFTNFIISLTSFITISLITYYVIEVLNNKSYFN